MTDGSVELNASLEVGQDSSDLFGKAEVQHSGSADAYGYAIIRNISSAEAYAHLIIRHSDSAEAYGHSIIKNVSSAEAYTHVIIRNIGSANAYAHLIVRNIGSSEFLGRTTIRHTTSKDLYANVEICHWEDLECKLIVRHSTYLDHPAIFWIRPLYRLWTNRRYLNGVVELNETLLGNAILEYVIEGVMQDIQSYLINAGLGYSEWTDISLTPKLIKRATTYGAVAALYARRTKTFTTRVIPTIAPVTITAIGDEERALNHWRDKMNKALEYYVTSQGGDVMLTSTNDEEPVFSMDDIPPVISAYTPWYQWLLRRQT